MSKKIENSAAVILKEAVDMFAIIGDDALIEFNVNGNKMYLDSIESPKNSKKIKFNLKVKLK